MNMKKYFVKLFEYEFWANNKILMHLEMNPTSKEITDLFSHMLADMKPWVMLLSKESVPDNIDCQPSWSIQQCKKELEEVHAKICSYINSVTTLELENKIKSKGPSGQIFTNSVTEVLTHMASHSQHHRGQIEMLIKQEIGTYLLVGYMPYLRREMYNT